MAYTRPQIQQALQQMLGIHISAADNHAILQAIKLKLASANDVSEVLTDILINLQEKIYLISSDYQEVQEQYEQPNIKAEPTKKE